MGGGGHKVRQAREIASANEQLAGVEVSEVWGGAVIGEREGEDRGTFGRLLRWEGMSVLREREQIIRDQLLP